MSRNNESSVFSALGHPTRRAVLAYLRDRDYVKVGDIAEAVGVAGSTLSGHLRVLREADLVVSRQRGTQVQYRIEVLMPEAPSIAQQSEEATLLTTTDVDSHPLDIVGGIEEQLREERLGEQDELMLLVGTCYGVEQGDEHRHVAHGGEADDEVAGHR